MHDAVRVVNGVRDLDVYIEQPCLSYEECVSVRRMCTLPFVIDESMDDIGTFHNYEVLMHLQSKHFSASLVGV